MPKLQSHRWKELGSLTHCLEESNPVVRNTHIALYENWKELHLNNTTFFFFFSLCLFPSLVLDLFRNQLYFIGELSLSDIISMAQLSQKILEITLALSENTLVFCLMAGS